MATERTRFPSYNEMVTRYQRYLIDCMICRCYRTSLGYNVDTVEYMVRHSAVRGGIRYIDLEAELKGVRRDFHVAIANARAIPYFGDLRAKGMHKSYDCGEKHVTLPLWMLALKTGTWRYTFRSP